MMRATALVLVTIISMLTFQPGVDLLFSCEEKSSCCIEKCDPFELTKDDSSEESGGCEGMACNPFLSCSISFVATDLIEMVPLNLSMVIRQEVFSNATLINKLLANDFWQPPRFA